MITGLILILYAVLILIFIVVSLFIAYHLASYALSSEIKFLVLAFFTVVSLGLLFSNLLLFFSVNWNGLTAKITF